MARAKKPKRRGKAAGREDRGTAGAPVQLIAVAIRELVYRELPLPGHVQVADLVATGTFRQPSLRVSSSITVAPQNLLEVSIQATLTPVGDLKAFELSVRLSGLFQRRADMANRDAAAQLSVLGGRLLFPFVREALMTAMSKTIFGALTIQPVTLEPLFPPEVLAGIAG